MRASHRFSGSPTPRHADPSAGSPLLALSHASAEVQAGSGGSQCLVRLLDNVCVRVHPGELVLIHGRDLAGQRALLSALAASPQSPMVRYLHATRSCAPTLRVCRGTIRALAVPHIMQAGPHGAAAHSARHRLTVPSLYLLRASRSEPLAPGEAEQWRRWSQSLLGGGGAIVLSAPQLISDASGAVSAIGEAPVRYAGSATTPHVRTLIMQHGRLVETAASASIGEAGQYCWPSDVPLVDGR